MIFLSLSFYVKSISGIPEVQKSDCFPILEALNFNCDDFLQFLSADIDQKSKLEAL